MVSYTMAQSSRHWRGTEGICANGDVWKSRRSYISTQSNGSGGFSLWLAHGGFAWIGPSRPDGSPGVSCGVGTCWFGGVDDGGDGDGVGRGGDVVDGDGVDGDGEWFGFGVDGLDRWGVVEGDCRGGDGDGDCSGWWSGMGMFV